jgi:hypothetical protein
VQLEGNLILSMQVLCVVMADRQHRWLAGHTWEMAAVMVEQAAAIQ